MFFGVGGVAIPGLSRSLQSQLGMSLSFFYEFWLGWLCCIAFIPDHPSGLVWLMD